MTNYDIDDAIQAATEPLENHHSEEALQSLDAALFSGDGFFNKPAIARLEWFLARWQRKIPELKEMAALDDEEGGGQSTTMRKVIFTTNETAINHGNR